MFSASPDGSCCKLWRKEKRPGKRWPNSQKGFCARRFRNWSRPWKGDWKKHHRFLLELQLRRLQAVEEDLAALEGRIQEKLKPYAAHLALLQEIPGVDWTLAAVIIAELGVDMSVFQSVSQAASWAGVCPGNNESAGKRNSSRIPKGNVYLKTPLVEAAQSAAKAKGTYLRDKFYRLKARRGYKRAVVAVAHKILVAIYHMLSEEVSYHDLGDCLPGQVQQTSPDSKPGSPPGAFRLYGDTGAESRITERVSAGPRLPAELCFHDSLEEVSNPHERSVGQACRLSKPRSTA